MNQLQVFSFEAKTIRTQIDELGAPLWIAKDVCDALGIKKNRDAVSRLRGNVTRPVKVDGIEMKAINEAGLYQLIMKSSKVEAERFQDWVTSEVLPTIRKTGSFTLDKKAQVFPAAEPVFKALASIAEIFGLEKNQALLYANKATKRETGVDFQTVLQIELKNDKQERCFTPTELGKQLNLSARKFNELLAEKGLQVKRGDVWCSTELGKSHSVLLDAGKKHSNGTPIQQLKWNESVLNILKTNAA